MKRILPLLVLIVLLSGYSQKTDSTYRYIKNSSFTFGEEIKYRVHYGFINGGEATFRVSKNVFTVNGRPCYKVDIFGRTTGMVDVMYNVDDNWGSYIDTAAILPQRFYRYIQEGKYRKNEIIDFDHSKNTALVARLHKKTKKLKEKVPFSVPDNIQDIVSGYYYLRTLDFSNYREGDIINISGFFDDEIYQMRFRFKGRDKLNTKIGDFQALVLQPIMPKNNLFDGEDAVEVWLSDDEKKIPLKIRASLFVGALEIDVKEYNSGKSL